MSVHPPRNSLVRRNRRRRVVVVAAAMVVVIVGAVAVDMVMVSVWVDALAAVAVDAGRAVNIASRRLAQSWQVARQLRAPSGPCV